MISKFTRENGSVYTCTDCGKRTRETGEGESQHELCAFCFMKASWHNCVVDGEMSIEEFNEIVAGLKKTYNHK
jgi:hypothetical protein